MVTGNTKEGGRLMRFMPKEYWPYSVAADGASSGMSWSRPRTTDVSTTLMMLMAELLRVMGMPMARIFFIRVPLLSGTSREWEGVRWVNR